MANVLKHTAAGAYSSLPGETGVATSQDFFGQSYNAEKTRFFEKENHVKEIQLGLMTIILFALLCGGISWLGFEQVINDEVGFNQIITKQYPIAGLVTDPPGSARLMMDKLLEFDIGWVAIAVLGVAIFHYFYNIVIMSSLGRRIFWIWMMQRRNPWRWFMRAIENILILGALYGLVVVAHWSSFAFMAIGVIVIMYLGMATEIIHHPDDKPLVLNPLSLSFMIMAGIVDLMVWAPVFVSYALIEYDIPIMVTVTISVVLAMWHALMLLWILVRTNVIGYGNYLILSTATHFIYVSSFAGLIFYAGVHDTNMLIV
jgi:hypothetical protein